MPHHRFHSPFIWAALAFALIPGFGLGAYIGAAVAGAEWLPGSFVALVAAHGQAQLSGFVGLFVMGVSIHFMPRLASVAGPPLPLQRLILAATSIGLAGRLAAPLVGDPMRVAAAALWAAGVGAYVAVMLRAGMRGRLRAAHPLRPLRPYLAMVAVGWLVQATGHLLLNGRAWLLWLHDAYLGMVVVPIALVFAVRLLPLFMRLPLPGSWVPWLAAPILVGEVMRAVAGLPPFAPGAGDGAGAGLTLLGDIARGLRGAGVIAFVLCLDVLLRARRTWRSQLGVDATPSGAAERGPARPGMPDWGEFGRFEVSLRLAFGWLLLAAGAEAVAAVVEIVAPGAGLFLPRDAVRHAYLLGFTTHLILGIAQRMLPGFMGRAGVVYPALVGVSTLLAALAALLRIVPILFPSLPGAAAAFAVSGQLAVGAVACLAWNLVATAQARGGATRRYF